MKLTGKVISIGLHDRDGEAVHGVLIEVPSEQLQQGGILYREVVVNPDYHAKVENPEVFNVDLLERERDAFAQKATALAVQASEQTKRWDATIRENERLTRERDEARALDSQATQHCVDVMNQRDAALDRVKRLEEALELGVGKKRAKELMDGNHIGESTEMVPQTKEVVCPDCYGGHFKPCNICGDSGVALIQVEAKETKP